MSRREFSTQVRRAAFRRADGHCECCTRPLSVGDVHFDHVIPDRLGGEPALENCEVLCRSCHAVKTYRHDVPNIARAKRRHDRHWGLKPKSGRPMDGSRRSRFRKHMDGSVSMRERS